MEIQAYPKGKTIFLEGSPATQIYQILSGSIGIYAAYGEADEQMLTELSAKEKEMVERYINYSMLQQ